MFSPHIEHHSAVWYILRGVVVAWAVAMTVMMVYVFWFTVEEVRFLHELAKLWSEQ